MSLLGDKAGPLFVLALVLVAGVMFGNLVRRFRLPAVTGQILVGILLGQSVLHIFPQTKVDAMLPITHFALGLMAVAVGNHIQFRRLRNAGKRLFSLLVLESVFTPVLVFLSVMLPVFLFGVTNTGWVMGALLAAMAVSTAPATIVAIVKETRSKGVFVKTLVAAVALNNIACILLFEFARAGVKVYLGDHVVSSALMAPLRQLLFSILLGGAAGVFLTIVTKNVVRPDRLATASIIAILLTTGMADYLDVSPLLACLFLGMTIANLTPQKEEIGHEVFANFESAILAIFFTLAGMELNFSYIAQAGVLAALVVAARVAGKTLSGNLAMRMAGATPKVRQWMGWALVPQAGVAVGLMLLIKEDAAFRDISDLFLAVGLTTVTFNELLGPVLTRMALVRSGDFGKDRARLIDFLHEENIVVDLPRGSKEETIERLVDLLIRQHHLKVDREKLLKSVMDREELGSTCIGRGLAIPHGILEGHEAIVGVMAISRDGLVLETPDGIPVHCIILLATPPEQRDHHLEVIAALTRAIGTDDSIRLQLFSTKSAAHAYELLHAEESEGYNYFLDDEVQGAN